MKRPKFVILEKRFYQYPDETESTCIECLVKNELNETVIFDEMRKAKDYITKNSFRMSPQETVPRKYVLKLLDIKEENGL